MATVACERNWSQGRERASLAFALGEAKVNADCSVSPCRSNQPEISQRRRHLSGFKAVFQHVVSSIEIKTV